MKFSLNSRNHVGTLMIYAGLFLFLSFVSIESYDDRTSTYVEEKKICDQTDKYPRDLGYRLPKDVLPRKYVIAVAPDFQRNIFHGAIQITCELLEVNQSQRSLPINLSIKNRVEHRELPCTICNADEAQWSLFKSANSFQPRDHVALHAKDLNIESTSFCRRRNRDSCLPCPLDSVYTVDRLEMIVLKFGKKIEPGIYTARINFSGPMDNRINGFYLSTYRSSPDNCTRRKLAVTQFEPTFARKAFPCFDEPGFKSIFEVKIIHPTSNGYHSMSNMPSIRVERPVGKNNLAVTSFATSLPMSTYSVAFLVSDFTCSTSIVDSLTGTSIPVSVCSSSSNKHKVQFALRVAMKTMTFYMKYFQIDYPLPKIDLVGVPDFAAGAMENWGLVTFRETEILQSDEHSSIGNTKSVALTIAHELAHMWFGNLVTLEWWDDLWLNEGFATYMEHVAVNYVFPEWKQMKNFALETKYLTMRSDSKITAHPIVRSTENADEIGQMFDHISYQKGAAVIRMLENAMGNVKFMHGIREYLSKYKFGNAATYNLFEVLEKHFDSEVNLVTFMKTWTELPGFPVLSVRRCCAAKYEIFQKRFFSRGSLIENSTWDLPIRYVTSRKEDGIQLVWFLSNATCAELLLENPVDWIKINHESIGYYVVNYSEDLWCTFSKLLCRDVEIMNPLDRADLLHDSFVLADSGQLDYASPLSLAKYLINETCFSPWVVAASWLLRVDRLLAGMQVHRHFRYFARYLIERVYSKVGWEVCDTEDIDKRELRMLILRVACSLGNRDCLRNGEERMKIFIESNGTIRPPADLRSIIYSFGLVRLDPNHLESYEIMWNLFLQENDPQEKERLLIGLADVREPEIIMRYLERVADEKLVRRQNFFEAIGKVASNPAGLDIVWNFLRNNWDFLVKKYTLNDAAMGSLVGKIVSSFKDVHRLDEAKKFFMRYPDAGAGANSRRLALEESASNIEWLSKNPDIIDQWLKSNYFYPTTENLSRE